MKQILAILILFQLALKANAQSYIGISASANSSGYTLSTPGASLTYNYTIGWGVGIPVEINLSEKLNLSTGLKYANKGSSLISFTADNIAYQPKIRVNYLEIPFLIKGKFGSNKTQINPIAGFSLGYGFSGTIEDFTMDNGFRKRNVNFDNDINAFLCQFHLGVGATFNLPKGAFSFDFQYLSGINNLLKTSTFPTNYSLLANGLEFTAGYLLKIGKDKSTAAPLKK